jgi:hypothetical protein
MSAIEAKADISRKRAPMSGNDPKPTPRAQQRALGPSIPLIRGEWQTTVAEW